MERYFWEFVILYRKITMIFILVFLVAYPLEIQVKKLKFYIITSYKALAIIAVSFLSYLIHIQSNPFIDEDLNLAEKRSLINSSITIYAGLYYIAGGLNDSISVLLFVLIVVMNSAFLVYIINKIYSNINFLAHLVKNIFQRTDKTIRKNRLREKIIEPVSKRCKN